MIDHGDLPRPTPEHTSLLNPEQINKCNLDLETITKLSNLANSLGGKLILNGGYAVEALLGGSITRPHGDIDAAFKLPSEELELPAVNGAVQILEEERSHTNWIPFPDAKERGHFMEYREENPGIPEFKDRRRIELYTYDQITHRVLVERVLRDSSGVEHKVIVPSIEEIVADKVRMFNRTEKDNESKRDTNATDINDFKRLISHESFNRDKYLELAAKILAFQSKKPLTDEEARTEAERQWRTAVDIISNPPPFK